MAESKAPIAIFAYKRPRHLENTLTSLLACDGVAGSPLYLFCDGPKKHAELAEVHETRRVGRELLGGKAQVIESETNQGLASSICSGVSRLCGEFGRVIVVEDDLELAPNFLSFLNDGLSRYANHTSVMHISAYMYPLASGASNSTAAFLPTIGSWGWATWNRAWRNFDPDATGWESIFQNPALRRKFDLDGAADFSSMLRAQMSGYLDSWVIRWYWRLFQLNGLVLYPPRSLVLNRGFDATGTHGARFTARVLGTERLQPIEKITYPSTVALSEDVLEEVKVLLKSIFGGRGRRTARNALVRLRFLARNFRK